MSRAARISLEELLEQAPWLRRLAATLVAGDAAAEDLVQETWLAALQHPPQRVAPLRPWLARVARNLAANFRRGEARRSEHESKSSRTPAELDPLGITGEVEAQRILAEAVLRLEEPLRTTVVLRYFRGLDSSEIGRLQGIPSGTVRWRLKHGLELLRADLDACFGGERRTWSIVFASLVSSGRNPESMLSANAGSTLTTGAALMSASTKVGVAAAAALAVLFTTWIAVGGEGGATKALVAGDGEPSIDSFPREQPAEIAAGLESPSEPRTREALGPGSAAPAEIALAECCIVGRILDREGRGIPGARIEARAAQLDRSTLRAQHASGERPRETQSGNDGSFSLEVPALRPFVLGATHPGFAAAASALAFGGERRDIVLAPGSELVVHVSESGAADERDSPCVGARVEARIAILHSDELLWKGEGSTDSSGTITFSGVPAGAVSVEGSFEKRRASARVTTDGGSRTSCELELRSTGRLEGTVVDRASHPIEGARVGIDRGPGSTTDRSGRYALDLISLGAGVQSLGARARGYSSSYEYVVVDEERDRQTVNFALEPAIRAIGTVLDRSGRAVAGASVTWAGALATAAFVGETDRGEVATDAHGRFELEELHPDTAYRLLVFSDDHATGVYACGPFAAPTAEAPPIELGSFTLDAGSSIAGDVPDARSSGEPRFIQLYWAGEDAASRSLSHLETVRTDPRGRFAFEGLSEGRYRLELWKSADPEWSEAPLAEVIVVLSAGEEREDVVLEASSQTITGRVSKESGEPFRRCTVRLFALPSPEIELSSTNTDEDGRFRFQVHDLGPYRVVAEDASLMFDSSAIEPAAPGDELDFVLREFRSEHVIRGVLLTESGEIPKDVFVSFTDSVTKQRLARVAIPGLDGRFEMKNLRALPYDLETVDFSNGYEIVRIPGVRPGQANVELHLKPRE